MIYIINNPDSVNQENEMIATDINKLLNKFPVHPNMLRSAIKVLEENTDNEKRINLGGFSLEIKSIEKTDYIIKTLKEYESSLESY